MLTYVVMILNHHRLCKHQTQLPPLHLVELFQGTHQIGAFQVRVRRSLSQVLFSSLQRSSFWNHWANWVLQTLEQWAETPSPMTPSICHTPGLLPLPNPDGIWSWRESIVIQAMALEAAHQLVESLPLESLETEALESLLGLQDALVEDSSTVDPKGFELVPLGVPILPEAWGRVTTQSEDPDPTLKRLPKISVRCCPQAPLSISAPLILSHWIWGLTQQLGTEVSTVGLLFIEQMARGPLPWQSAIAVTGTEAMMALGETPGSSALQAFARRVELLCQSNLRWEERRLESRQVHHRPEKVWRLDTLQVSHALFLNRGQSSVYADAPPHYEQGEVEAVKLQVAPGPWCRRLIDWYGDGVSQALLEFSRIARQILAMAPSRHRLTAKVAIFLVHQFWLGQGPEQTVGQLLGAVEPMEKIQALASSAIRRDTFFQAWASMLAQFQGVGWIIPENPLQGWDDAPLGAMDWLDEPITIQIQTQDVPLDLSRQSRTPVSPAIAMAVDRAETLASAPERQDRMEQISSHALERALAARGMSQAKLARSLNLDRSTINRWINGSRPIHPRYRPMLWNLLGSDLQRSP